MKNPFLTLFAALLVLVPLISTAQPMIHTVIVLDIEDHKDFEHDFLGGVPAETLNIGYDLFAMLALDPQYADQLTANDPDLKKTVDYTVREINNQDNKKSFKVKTKKKLSPKNNLIRLLGNGTCTVIMDSILGAYGRHTNILSPVSIKGNAAIIHIEGKKRVGGFAKYHIKLTGDRIEYTLLAGNRIEYMEIAEDLDQIKKPRYAFFDNNYGLGVRLGLGIAGTTMDAKNAVKKSPSFSDYTNKVSYTAGLVYNHGIGKSKQFFLQFGLDYLYFNSKLTTDRNTEHEQMSNIAINELSPRIGIGCRINIGNKNSIDLGLAYQYKINLEIPAFSFSSMVLSPFLNVTIKRIHIGLDYSPFGSYSSGLHFNIGYNFGNFKKQ